MIDAAESRGRMVALGVFGLAVLILIYLSAVSFAGGRERPDPAAFGFRGQSGVDGKRVYQAYNCMGCHTMLGNGAYFGPDLTKVYEDGGRAWLLAFLPSPGTWPTRQALDQQIEQLVKSGELDVASPAAYYERYPHVKETVDRFGGQRTAMPNLAFRADEIVALSAFLNYAAEINTAGWPPQSIADPGVVERLKTSILGPPPEQRTAP